MVRKLNFEECDALKFISNCGHISQRFLEHFVLPPPLDWPFESTLLDFSLDNDSNGDYQPGLDLLF
jgi:hypothetical protein